MDGDCVFGLVEEDAVVADAEAEQAFELTAERLDATGTGFGVAMNTFEDVECGPLLDGADFGLDIRPKAGLL